MEILSASFQALNPNIFSKEQACIWIYEHPVITKITEIAGLALGAGLVAWPFSYPICGTVLPLLSGSLLTLASSVALFALDLIIPPHHDMKSHMYTPGICEGGRLYYEGDVPILSLDSANPFQAGQAHGYLCGEAIDRLTKRFDLILHTLAGQPRAEGLPKTLAEIRKTIPSEYLRELEGLVVGYNKWASEQFWWKCPKKLTLDDALLLHLMPDSIHFRPEMFEGEKRSFEESAVACSVVIDRDIQERFVFARNMDWPSFGLAGAYSLVIHRHHANGLLSTVEVGIPGIVGTLTGMNENGLSLAMNVCNGYTRTIRGMPATFYNRVCLERCQTVKDVEDFIHNEPPLGPYHLTVADQSQAESIHFYQSVAGTHQIRRWEENNPLSTLNCRYSPMPNCPMHYSNERQIAIRGFFQSRDKEPLEEVLSLPFVNNWLTTHRVVMKPETGTFEVAFDNAFAGNAPLHSVPANRLFQREVK